VEYGCTLSNAIVRSTLELLGVGRRLADRLGVPLSSVLVGYGVRKLSRELVAYGADKVYVADDPALKYYNTLLYAKVLSELIVREEPEIVLFAATTVGRDLAPRIDRRLYGLRCRGLR